MVVLEYRLSFSGFRNYYFSSYFFIFIMSHYELYELCVFAETKRNGSDEERAESFQNIRDWLADDKNPREAAAQYRNYPDGSSPFRLLLAAQPPFDLLRKLIDFLPKCEQLYALCFIAQDARDKAKQEREEVFQNIREWLDDDRNPCDAAVRYINLQDNTMPLHVLVAARPTLDLVAKIVHFAPGAVGYRFWNGEADLSPIEIARENQAPPDVVDYLLKCGLLYKLCSIAWNERDNSDEIREAAFQNIRDWLDDDRNPCEAAARYNHQYDNRMPLHELVAARPPLDLVKSVINYAPEAVGQIAVQGLPIDIARNNQSSQDVIDYLFNYLPTCAQPNVLHALCLIAQNSSNKSNEEREAVLTAIRFWLDNDQNPREAAARYVNQDDGQMPLHVLVASRPPIDLLLKLIDFLPKCEQLYALCFIAENLRDNTEQEREALFQNIRDWLYDDRNPREAAAQYINLQDNTMPLHVLVAARPPLDLVARIIHFAPGAVGYRFRDGDLPIDIARENQAPPDVIDFFLKCEQLYNLCLIARNERYHSIEERQALFQYIRDWLYDDRNPREAAAQYINLQDNTMPLHELVAARPPLDLVKIIISYAPVAVGQIANGILLHGLPIDIARNSNSSQDVIDYLCEYLPTCAQPNVLHALCFIAGNERNGSNEKREAAFTRIRDWLNNNQNPREAAAQYMNKRVNRNYTPLDTIVAARPPLDLVKTIIDLAPQTVKTKSYGSLPLHVACQYGASVDVVEELLKFGGADQTDFNGNLPLHYTCCAKYPDCLDLKVITKVLEKYPEGSNQENFKKMIPIELALRSGSSDVLAFLFDSLGKFYRVRKIPLSLKLCCILQSLPENLRHRFVLENYLQKLLHEPLTKLLPTFIILLDLYCSLAAIVCSGIAVSKYNAYIFESSTGIHPDDVIVPSYILLFVGAYLALRQIMQMMILSHLGFFKIWYSKISSFVELSCSCFMIISASIMLTNAVNSESSPSGKEWYRVSSIIFSGLYFYLLFPFGRIIITDFAVFERSMTEVIKHLLGFGVYVVIIVTSFALMFFTVFKKYSENECDDFCDFWSSWFQVWVMMLGDYGSAPIFDVQQTIFVYIL